MKPNKQMAGGMTMVAATILAAFAEGCCADGRCNEPETARYGVVKIAFGASIDGTAPWRADQLQALAPLDRELDALGPDFVTVSESDPQSIVVRPATLPRGVCGRYRLGEDMVEVDPTCTQGYLALRKAAAHELVHALLWRRFQWAKHLCWFPLNSPVPRECHPTIVCRECLMSPNLHPDDTWGDTIEEYVPGVAIPEPQPDDVRLVRACYDNGRCE